MVIAVLLCYPLTFSGFTIPANLFCIPFMISFRKHCCSLPTAFFLSSVCQSTDVETFRWFLNACIICFYREIYKLPDASTIIMALLVSSRLEVLRRVCAVIFLVYVYSLSHNRHGWLFSVVTLTTCYTYQVLCFVAAYIGFCYKIIKATWFWLLHFY